MEVSRVENMLVRQRHGSFQHGAKLTNIAGPGIFAQPQQSVAGERDLVAPFDAEPFQEVFGKFRDVLHVIAQGRHHDLDALQPEEQVLAETVGFHVAVQIAMGGGEDAHVDLDFCLGAHRSKTLALDHAQQLGLAFRR